MSTRLSDSARTKIIAEFIRSGKSPEGYEVIENQSSKYKVRKIKPQEEILKTKRDRLIKQLEEIEKQIADIEDKKQTKENNDNEDNDNENDSLKKDLV